MVRDSQFPTRLLLAAVGVGAGVGAVISVASSGLAAYFARRIVVPENAPEELAILHIAGFSPNMRIHLPADEETTVPGTYGLYFSQGAGHAVIGDIVEYDPRSQTVSREILSVTKGDIRRARHG
ncbi:alpha/beta hydrolase, partial [Burkholderia multivorans]